MQINAQITMKGDRIMTDSAALTIEQQLSLKLIQMKVEAMSHSEVQSALIELYGKMLLRENAYKHALKAQWGIESPKH